MAVVTAREALRYAISREMALLYAVVIVGALLIGLGVGTLPRPRRGGNLFLLFDILEVLLVVGGTVLVYGGFVAIAYKLVADAHARGTA
jgi:hypothetical protein